MKAISQDELSRMKATQVSAMLDTCMLMRYGETPDSINHPVPTWTQGPVMACGFDPTGGLERRSSNRTTVTWEAFLRLPLETVLDLRDRILIIARYGQPYQPTLYEIAGPPEIGPSGMVVPLRKVEPSV